MKKHFLWTFLLSTLAISVVFCKYGITVRDKKENFTIFTEGSVASDFEEAEDGSFSWIATAVGDGGGGGASFYIKANKEEINIANYESIDIELDYSIVKKKWDDNADNPSFGIRILPWDSTGLFGGFEPLTTFYCDAKSGTLKRSITIPSDFAERIKASCDFDSVLGFAIKLNDYNRGNKAGDQVKVQLKNVKFNAKENAKEDKAFDDGLKKSQHGSVVEIYYPTHDYTVEKVTDDDKYEKHAWVYLPAGYDESDKDTKYPVFILLHGFGQNENTWGLSNKGRGGRIKGYMDRGMANGDVTKFILVTATGVASKNWGPNGAGRDFNGYNAFKGELRDDLLPYLRDNFNIKDGRDNVALAGLSAGGVQTFIIGIAECLDIISHFGGFSGYLSGEATEFMNKIDSNKKNTFFKIHNLYMTCGDADQIAYPAFPGLVKDLRNWERVENFKAYTYPGGTHDFPVWFNGFIDFIYMIFK